MVDRRREQRLTLKAVAEGLVLGELRGDRLERDRAAERDLRCPPDDTHPAATGDRFEPAAGDL